MHHRLIGGRAGYITNKLSAPSAAIRGLSSGQQRTAAPAPTPKSRRAGPSSATAAGGRRQPGRCHAYLRYERCHCTAGDGCRSRRAGRIGTSPPCATRPSPAASCRTHTATSRPRSARPSRPASGAAARAVAYRPTPGGADERSRSPTSTGGTDDLAGTGLADRRKHSTYGLAVTRMILGFIVASQLVVNWPDRHYTWGDGARWTVTVRDAKTGRRSSVCSRGQRVGIRPCLSRHDRLRPPPDARPLHAGLTFMTLFLWMSLYVADPFVGSGGDAVLRMVMLYLCFVDAGQRWSVDARLRARRGEIRPLMPEWFSATLHNLAMILIIHQVVMVYVGVRILEGAERGLEERHGGLLPAADRRVLAVARPASPGLCDAPIIARRHLHGDRRPAVLPRAADLSARPAWWR